MINEDQLEQLVIQWFKDTGGENIEHRTPNIESRSEEKGRLAEVRRRVAMPGQVSRRVAMPGRVVHEVTKPEHAMCRPFRAWNPVVDGTQGVALGCRLMPRWGDGGERGKPLNKERRYPIALTMRGPWGGGLTRFMGFPWASAIGYRRSLGMVRRWGGKKERNLKP